MTAPGSLLSAVVAVSVRELLPPGAGEFLARLSEAGLLVPLAVGGAVAVVGGASALYLSSAGRGPRALLREEGGPCTEERRAWERAREACENADCTDEKRAVEAAERALAAAKADRDERAAAVAAAHDDVRGASAGHGAAVDEYEAAEEAADAARDRLAEAKRALLDVLQAHYDERAAEMGTEAADLELVPVGDSHGSAVTFDAGGVRAGFDVGDGFSESDLRRFARLMETDVRERLAGSTAYQEALDAVQAAREAVDAAESEVDEARSKLADHADALETEDDEYRDAIEARDAAKRRVEEARERLEAARDALEDCREEKQRLCERAEQATERLEECEEATEAVEAAERAVEEAETDVEGARSDVDDVREEAGDEVEEDPRVGPKLDEAGEGVEEAEKKLREAREKLAEAEEKLRDGDYEGATSASGSAGRAAADASDVADDASEAAEEADDAADEIRAKDRERRQQERRFKNCLDNFAAWVRDNETHVDSDDVDALAALLREVDEDLYRQYEALRESGALAEDDEEAREAIEKLFWVAVRGGGDFGSVTLGGMAGGTGGGTAAATGSVPGAIAVAAFLLYAEAKEAGMVAAKRVADEGAIRQRLKAFRTRGNPCSCEPKELEGDLLGIEVDSATSWFLLCVDGPRQVLLFRITASHGLELLGVGDLTEGAVTASPLE